jgi:glycosyltransferase involved in cell wall biosynthesis
VATTKLLCVLSEVLGNARVSRRFESAITKIGWIEPLFARVTPDDYITMQVPAWTRLTSSWHAQEIARRKAKLLLDQPIDMLFVDAWEFIPCFRGLATKVPAAAFLDATPRTFAELRSNVGAARRLANRFHHRAFSSALRPYDYFFPRTSYCKRFLTNDYGVDESRCYVAGPVQDLNRWKPAAERPLGPIRVFFVGNDFRRKGGEFLLNLYSKYLSTDCELTIASNDPSLAARELPAGVTLIQGANRDTLLRTYRESDLFVFPTQQDFAPEVMGEALATGLPCFTTNVGGAGDLIVDGVSGFLFEPNTSAELWAQKLRGVIGDPELLRRMKQSTRQIAEERLSTERFEKMVCEVFENLRDAKQISKFLTKSTSGR